MSELQLIEPSHDEIADCAYFHWLNDGAPHTSDDQNWFAAETQLMQQWMAAQGTVWVRETAHLPHGFPRDTMRV